MNSADEVDHRGLGVVGAPAMSGGAGAEPGAGGGPVAAGFAEEVRQVAMGVRLALAEALNACGVDVRRPQELGRQLKLDKSLAWKLSRVVTDEDPLAAVTRLPGRSGARLMFTALERGGSPRALSERLQRAMESFEQAIETHAGDREAFEMMLAELSPAGQARHEVYREMAFKGASATFGVRARVHQACQLVRPTVGQPGMLDIGTISGLLGLVRLRTQTPWPIAQIRNFSGDGAVKPSKALLPMDPEGVTAEGMMLVREFSSRSLPPLRAVSPHPGLIRFEVQGDAVGKTGAIDCISGWYERSTVSMYRTESDTLGEHLVHTVTPCEVLYFDLVVHTSMTFAFKPEAAAYGLLPGGLTYPQDGRDRGRIPLEVRVEYLEVDDLARATPEIPRYDHLVAMGIARLGGQPGEFTVRRVRVPYPPMPAQVVLRYELPSR